MRLSRARIVQLVAITIIQALAVFILEYFLPGISVRNPWDAFLIVAIAAVGQAIFWWVFIHFLGYLPVILYPILTFVLTGAAVAVVGNQVPGIEIDGWAPGLWIIVTLTVVNALIGGLFSLDEDAAFDRNVTRKMVSKYGHPTASDVPGFLFLEIDGLSPEVLDIALKDGYLPTVKRWLDDRSHALLGWETDFSSQTGSMQPGILLGNNDNIPAYRWWDRAQGRIVMSGNPRDARRIEAQLSNGLGLLADGGASRGNMYSGDATESLFTFSTLLNRQRDSGPGFYFYLFSPFVVFRLITRYTIDVVKEWYQNIRQRLRKDPYRISARTPWYAFFRAAMGPLLQDLTTFSVITDMMRGVPAVYALYAGYDDVAHFAGMLTEDALEVLEETDHAFARIERALQYAPRPYHIVVLSDHGQTRGRTFKAAYGQSLESLVKGLIRGDDVFAALDTNELYDNLNAFLSESVNGKTRTAAVVRRMVQSNLADGVVEFGPERDPEEARQEEDKAKRAKVLVLGSGSSGLIYFKGATERMSYEQIQDTYPDLLPGLVSHPGIGWVLVKSESKGSMALGKKGINFVDEGVVEGADPLASLGPNAAQHVRRQSSFSNCPDILVSTAFDPETQEMAGFENQASHHGGLGGPQGHGFVLYPVKLPYDGVPIVGAPHLYELLRGWREQAQGTLASAVPRSELL